MIQALLLDLLVLLAYFLLGFQLLQSLLAADDHLERIAYAFPLGAGVFTWLMFLLSWAGIPLTRLSLLLLFGVLLVIARALPSLMRREARLVSGRTPFPSWLSLTQGHPALKWIWGLFGALMLFAFVFAVSRSYGEAYDAIAIWATQGYGIANANTIFAGAEWGWWGLSYPLNLMLQIGTFMLFGGELLPGSKLLYPLYLICLCLAAYGFWLRGGVHKLLAGLGVLFLATNPAVFHYSTNGLSNLPFAVIFCLGCLAMVDGIEKRDKTRQLLAGIFLGLTAWTRPEGIGFSLAALILIAIISRVVRAGKVYFLHLALPVLIIYAPWHVFGWNNVLDVELPLGAAIASVFPNLKQGNLNLFELYRIPRIFLDRVLRPDNWGAFVPVVAALLIFGLAIHKPWRRTKNLYLAALAFLASAIPVGIYYVVSFEPFDNYLEVLRRDFDRAFLPGFSLLTLLAIHLWSREKGAPETVPNDMNVPEIAGPPDEAST